MVCQPYYNLLNRQPEVEVLPACLHHGIGVVPYSPIARGVLAAKYTPGAPPAAGTRAGRGDARMMQTEFREESLRAAQTLKAHCETKGVAPSQFATAWVLAHRAVSSVIAGPRTFAQWQDYLGALDYAGSTMPTRRWSIAWSRRAIRRRRATTIRRIRCRRAASLNQWCYHSIMRCER